MTHHTRPYTSIIIYSSEKDEKAEMFVVQRMKGNLRSLLILMQGFETQPASPQRRPQAMSHSFNILSVSAGLDYTRNGILILQHISMYLSLDLTGQTGW